MEFQVVEKLAAGYLIGRDVTCAHKAIIDEEAGYITFPLSQPPFKVPITEGNRFNKTKTDSRVHAAERAILKLHSEEWVPIDFTRTIDGDLFISPVRKPIIAEGAYATCSYSIISKTTTHLLFINLTNRPAKIGQGEIVATAEPFKPNTRCSYFGTSALLSSILGLSTVPISTFTLTPAIPSTYNRPITGNPLPTSVSLSEPQPQHKIGQKMGGAPDVVPDVTPDVTPDITADPMSQAISM